jgi:hypothetical protein
MKHEMFKKRGRLSKPVDVESTPFHAAPDRGLDVRRDASEQYNHAEAVSRDSNRCTEGVGFFNGCCGPLLNRIDEQQVAVGESDFAEQGLNLTPKELGFDVHG